MYIKHEQIKELYFDDPMLRMGAVGRFAVRFAIYSAYGVIVAGALAFLLSDISWLGDFGILLALFLGDRLLHIGDAEKNFVRPPKGSVNISDYITPAARVIIGAAYARYRVFGGNIYLHIFERLLLRKEATPILRRLEVSTEEVLSKINEHLVRQHSGSIDLAAARSRVEELARSAWNLAVAAQSFAITPADFLSALPATGDADVLRVLNMFGITHDDFQYAVLMVAAAQKLRGLSRIPATLTGIAHGPYRVRHRVMNRAWTARPTPTLDMYSRDLTDLARMETVGFLVGHQEEYERLVDALARLGHPNAMLVGDEGAGKEAVVMHLAFRIAKDRVPSPLFDQRLVELNLGALVSGADPAELARRAQKIVDEIARTGNVILYIPNIHDLLKTASPNELSVADILLPAIRSDLFSVIGATYQREFSASIEKRSDFSGAFEIIKIAEISEADTTRLLSYQSVILEREYKIFITLPAIRRASSIAHKYLRDRLLPGSAELLLKEALADAKERGGSVLSPEDIIRVASRKTNVPLQATSTDEAGKLLNLEATIHEQLIDQEEAVVAVARSLREYRSGLSRRGGPMGAFLFVGPTGVGKTELAKILAEIQFGSRESMIRFDMSEFREAGSIVRFIGSPDGNISGALTEAARAHPFSLILLDEFEKAHGDVLNLFLQVFDDGRLTDGLGRTVDFTNAIIVATSNANSEFIASSLRSGMPMSEISEALKKQLISAFRPELLNRFSAIVIFKPLASEHIKAIARLELKKFAKGLEEQGIAFQATEAAVKEIARLGYDPTFGARPLRGVISDRIKSVLAEKILRQEIKRGDRITIDFVNGEFMFSIMTNF